MKISIVTINYNDAEGLRKTLASVAEQTYRDIEHIIIDGGSTDGSVEVILEYVASNQSNKVNDPFFKHTIKWISEKDDGIYNAMNKGIRKATGSYIQILNSGDLLISDDIIQRMMSIIEEKQYPELLYGNAVDIYEGKRISSHGPGIEYSLLQLYRATYPHESTFFRRDMFDNKQYGLYDENLKIVSDWKWYLKAIGLGNIKPIYVDVDVMLFDVTGISSTNKDLDKQERRQVLEEVLPITILRDLDNYAFPISQYQRLKKYHLWGVVYFMERVLFKLEKWHILK